MQTGDRIEWMGVIAGSSSNEEQALLPGVADTVSISMMMFLPESGEIEGITVVLPRELLTDGAAPNTRQRTPSAPWPGAFRPAQPCLNGSSL